MHTQANKMLKKLENLVRSDILTPAQKVEHGTFVCFKETLPNGMLNYHQYALDDMPANLQQDFLNKRKGEEFGTVKILAVFDIWSDSALKSEFVQKKPVKESN